MFEGICEHCGNIKGKDTLIWAETGLAEINPWSALSEIHIIWLSRHGKNIDCNYNLMLSVCLKEYKAGKITFLTSLCCFWWIGSLICLHIQQDTNINDRQNSKGSEFRFSSERIQASLNLLGLGLQMLHKQACDHMKKGKCLVPKDIY